MSAWARVAKITKTRNLGGSVVARSADGLPFLLFPGLQIQFVPPTLKGPRTASVASVQQIGEDRYEVFFDGIDAIEDAEQIAGCYCLAAKSDLPQVSADLPVELVGYAVHDVRLGDLGEVDEVLASPAQSLISANGPCGGILIPFVDAFVLDVDDKDRAIRVSIPEGLLNLDASGEAEDGDARDVADANADGGRA